MLSPDTSSKTRTKEPIQKTETNAQPGEGSAWLCTSAADSPFMLALNRTSFFY